MERLRALFPMRLNECSLGFLLQNKSMRVRVKERVRQKEQRKILGFLMLLRVNMEVKTRMRERKKGLRPRFLLILTVKLKVIVIQGK